jgi:hypothetical protein
MRATLSNTPIQSTIRKGSRQEAALNRDQIHPMRARSERRGLRPIQRLTTWSVSSRWGRACWSGT